MVEQALIPAPVAAAPAAPVVETPPAAPVIVPQVGAPTDPAASPAATPAVAEAPAAEPAAPSAEMQEYYARIQMESARVQTQAMDIYQQEFVTKKSAELEATHGMTPEAAKQIATEYAAVVRQNIDAQRSRQLQTQTAFQIAREFKIDASILIDLPSREAMIYTARAQGQQGQVSAELASLRAEVARLKKAPAQTYANGAVSGDGASATADNIDALWLQGKVSDERYRKWVNTRQL